MKQLNRKPIEMLTVGTTLVRKDTGEKCTLQSIIKGENGQEENTYMFIGFAVGYKTMNKLFKRSASGFVVEE